MNLHKEKEWLLMHLPGTNLHPGTASLQTQDGKWLIYSRYSVSVVPYENSDIFRLKTTFRFIQNMWFPGYITFETFDRQYYYLQCQASDTLVLVNRVSAYGEFSSWSVSDPSE